MPLLTKRLFWLERDSRTTCGSSRRSMITLAGGTTTRSSRVVPDAQLPDYIEDPKTVLTS